MRLVTSLVPCAVAVLLATAPARASDFNAGTETVESGPVSATLSWDRGEFGPQNTTLTIARDGVVAFRRPIPRVCGVDCQLEPGDADDFQLADLDGDGEQEVVVTASNQGHCCVTLGIYDFRAATGTYGELMRDLGSPFRLEDADRARRLRRPRESRAHRRRLLRLLHRYGYR